MGSKVLFQSTVHGKRSDFKPQDTEPLKKKWVRAVKQLVDTVAPGFNPRRTRQRGNE